MPAPPGANTKWVEGLRGMASLLVVTAHITRSLAPWVLAPTLSEKGGTVLMQLPLLRALTVGRPSVAVFGIVSGFVNSLKPVRQTRGGQVEATLHGVAKAAYRRTGRFIIPAMVATVIAWTLCQFGAYQVTRYCESQWMRDTSPFRSRNIIRGVYDLVHNLITTWTSGANEYDKVQWTLTYLLRGSMLVYLTLFATAYVEPNYRYMVYGILYFYYYAMGDATIGINVYTGMIMAELNFTPEVQDYVDHRPLTVSAVSTGLMVVGFLCNSYPEVNPEWAPWSQSMLRLGTVIFPQGAELSRFYPAIGSQLICLGIMYNSTAKRILSSPWLCWLGSISWPVYLIHGTLIRIVLGPLLYGMSSRPPSPGVDEHGHPLPQPWRPLYSKWNIVFAIPLFYVLLYRLAALWAAYVDPMCGRITNWVEQKIFRMEETAEKPVQIA